MNRLESLPKSSRVWVYQADRLLTEDENDEIQSICDEFAKNWNSHGTTLSSAIQLFNQLHIVVAVDENHKDASGCSIDKSVKLIQELGEKFGIDFFNRLNVAYVEDDELKLIHSAKFYEVGNDATLVFNNLIESISDIQEKWLVPARSSWLKP